MAKIAVSPTITESLKRYNRRVQAEAFQAFQTPEGMRSFLAGVLVAMTEEVDPDDP